MNKDNFSTESKDLPPTGLELIIKERERQITQEGWTPEHDSLHKDGDLALAGTCYAAHAIRMLTSRHTHLIEYIKDSWPWDDRYWKPTPNDPIRELVKAGALIAAEIDRLQRLKK
jgi:hypothetical protein